MDEILKLARSFRFETADDQLVHLADQILRLIEPKIHLFCASSIRNELDADETAQECLIAVGRDLAKFRGDTTEEFWAWCFAIARHKIKDHFRRKATQEDRFVPLPPNELLRLVNNAVHDGGIPASDKLDLHKAIERLRQAEPECLEFLWKHFMFGLSYGEIAADHGLTYDGARMRVNRCIDVAHAAVA
jgi:RNA polymerase sigma factor (sigma-70 family)